MAEPLHPETLPPDEPPRPRPHAQLPEASRIVAWVQGGRLVFAGAAFLLAIGEQPLTRGRMVSATALLLLTLAYTVVVAANARRLRGSLPLAFVYAQLIVDALLVTAAVHLTGGEQSIMAPLYILIIFAAALLLPLGGVVLIGALVALLALARATWWNGGLDGSAPLQVLLYASVAFITAYLADRLRKTGAELGEVQTELRLLRLDTGEILDSIGTAIITVDGNGRLVYINPAGAEILGLSPGQWAGKPILDTLDRIAPGLGTVIRHSAEACTPIRRFETEPLADDSFVLGVSTTLMKRPEGERPPVTAIFQDITEKMRVEALRRRAERLEAVAELSASLAHEIKNPLASIRSAVEQITAGTVDEEDGLLLQSLVVRESDRLSRLLAEFIDFARVKVTAPQPVDFAALVRDVAALVRAHPDARGRELGVDIEGAPEHLWIRGAEDLLHRAVLNLALNGLQWAGDGGRVELTLDEVRSDLLSPALGALTLLRLTVADTGPGVDEEIVDQIFNPFFTRRPGGTGLGLALVQRAVEAHGGAIFVDNAPAHTGLGAMFTLYLPALPAEAHALVAAPHSDNRTEP